jgi:hypothetical protein
LITRKIEEEKHTKIVKNFDFLTFLVVFAFSRGEFEYPHFAQSFKVFQRKSDLKKVKKHIKFLTIFIV